MKSLFMDSKQGSDFIAYIFEVMTARRIARGRKSRGNTRFYAPKDGFDEIAEFGLSMCAQRIRAGTCRSTNDERTCNANRSQYVICRTLCAGMAFDPRSRAATPPAGAPV